jgi:uncharacterized membrane protein YfbV (UPF0208 family)
MLDNITPLEEAILKAYDFGAALAATQVITELVNSNVELRTEKSRTPLCGQTIERRKEIMVEIRRNEQALSLVAQLNEMQHGISG